MTIAKSQQSPTLGKLTSIKGRIRAEEDLCIFGVFEGLVDAPAHKVTIGTGAKLTGNVTAREVIVYGTVDGNLAAAERISIMQAANVTGDIRTPRIAIEDGAFYEGSIRIVAPHSLVARKPADSVRVIAEGPSFVAVMGE